MPDAPALNVQEPFMLMAAAAVVCTTIEGIPLPVWVIKPVPVRVNEPEFCTVVEPLLLDEVIRPLLLIVGD